jgi:hypothetical protein
MGRHSKPSPKRISFLGSTAGAFGALVIAAGIFAASSLSGDVPQAKPKEIQEPIQTEQTVSDRVQPTTSGVTTQAPVTVVAPTEIPPRVEPPVIKTVTPETSVEARVTVPPVADVGVDADIDVDVSLLGQAVDTVTDTVTDVLDNINDLLGK